MAHTKALHQIWPYGAPYPFIGNIVLFFHPDARVPGQPYRMLDFGGAIAIAAMLVMAVVAAIAHTRQLYLQETI